MRSNTYIRYLISIVLIFMFALSITPKKILHNLVADHTDKPANTSSKHTHSVETSGYHCNIDNLVAESPFVETFPSINIELPALFLSYNEKAHHSFYSLHHFFSELRGPPSFILPV